MSAPLPVPSPSRTRIAPRPTAGLDRVAVAASMGIVLAAVSWPWLWGLLRAPGGWRFWGATWFAPDDGLLLSVVWEGFQGHWLHSPPYAEAAGPGALFYPFYVLLGHAARLAGTSPLIAYCSARLVAGAVLLATSWWFTRRFFPTVRGRLLAFWLAVTGAGAEWLWLWIDPRRPVRYDSPEAYPFASMLANTHFALATAALLWILDTLVQAGERRPGPWRLSGFALAALFLASMQPFGSVVASCVGSLWIAWRWRSRGAPPRASVVLAIVLVLATVPFVLHQVTTIARNPAYAGWRTQVHTPTPPAWQYLVRGGFALPLALVGLIGALRSRRSEDVLLVGWIASIVVLLALPYYQSRRFDLAGYVPLAFLAARGIRAIRPLRSAAFGLPFTVLNAGSSLLMLWTLLARIADVSPVYFVPPDRWEAIRYLRDHAPERSVVLARPLTSLVVMASTPLRIVYGHPTEIPGGEEARLAVSDYFLRDRPLPDPLMREVDYVLADAGERIPIPAGFAVRFRSGRAVVYGRAP